MLHHIACTDSRKILKRNMNSNHEVKIIHANFCHTKVNHIEGDSLLSMTISKQSS